MQDTSILNGIDTGALQQVVEGVTRDPSQGRVTFGIRTSWLGGARTSAQALPVSLGNQTIDRNFNIESDEPLEILGTNKAANPQELLLTALNACITVGFVANAAARGIQIDNLEVVSNGSLDMRGFLGLDPNINPGYDAVSVEVRIRSKADAKAIEELFAHVIKTSPNFNNFARPIAVEASLQFQRA